MSRLLSNRRVATSSRRLGTGTKTSQADRFAEGLRYIFHGVPLNFSVKNITVFTARWMGGVGAMRRQWPASK
jgi:hypothetical protein